MGKHACGMGNTHAKSAIECVFPKTISKIMKFLLKMRKRFEAEQPFLVVVQNFFCSKVFVY